MEIHGRSMFDQSGIMNKVGSSLRDTSLRFVLPSLSQMLREK